MATRLLDVMRGHEFRHVTGDDGIERVEDHCSRAEVYAASTVTRPELDAITARFRLAEMERRREYARARDAERIDRMADEWAAGRSL